MVITWTPEPTRDTIRSRGLGKSTKACLARHPRLEPSNDLALADDEGHTDLVGADNLGRLLAKHPTLRLVVLNACNTARGSASDTFSSTAAVLIRREIPAVMAMQFEMSNPAAIVFAQPFY